MCDAAACGNGGGMSEPAQTSFRYRLVGTDGHQIGERELPTDGEALTWAEQERGEGPGIRVLRVEREVEGAWVPVEEGGTIAAHRSGEDL